MAKIQGIGDLSPGPFSPEDIAEIQQQLESLIRLARKLGVVPHGCGLRELRGHFQRHELPTTVKERAANHLALASFLLQALSEIPSYHRDAKEYLRFAAQSGAIALGYMAALRDVRRELSKRGTNGRRRIGDKTREQVRHQVQPHRGQMSREAAAILVADAIRKSPATVRRLLSELFPGESWADR